MNSAAQRSTRSFTTPWWRACGASMVVHSALVVGLAWATIGSQGASSAPENLLAQFEEPRPAELLVPLEHAEQSSALATAGGSGGDGVGTGPHGRGVAALDGQMSVELETPGAGPGDGPGAVELSRADLREVRGGDEASFFGIRAAGTRFVFIVDMSGSMNEGGRFRRAIAELKQSLRGLFTSQEYYIFFFSDLTVPMPAHDLLPATNDNLLATFRWMKYVEPAGHTFPLAAVTRAHELKPDAIFLLSDGAFGPEVLDFVNQNLPSGAIPIHTIALENRSGEPMMRAISTLTRGTFRFVR
ncbi:MAG TPA: hypothetical protein VG713_03945 [Pirellulales bacterium]|nr:hypothetical protein [Pirellulales bacterium]